MVGGNDETETYVVSTKNAYLDGQGHLVIAVTAAGRGYNSARLTSTFSQHYGHWEASMTLPNATGCWPAFWFLGKNGAWPECGECDVVENYGTGFTDRTISDSTATANQSNISADPMRSEIPRLSYGLVKGSIHLHRDDVLCVTSTSEKLTPWPFNSYGGMYAIPDIATDGTGTNGVASISWPRCQSVCWWTTCTPGSERSASRSCSTGPSLCAHARNRSRIFSRCSGEQPGQPVEIGGRAQVQLDPVTPRTVMADGRIVRVVRPSL